MDRDWARERLEAFRFMCQEYQRSIPPGGYVGDEGLRDEAYRMEPTARAIMRRLDPSLADFDTAMVNGFHNAARAASRGIGMLADMDALAEKLGPTGPELSATNLHPWVWDAAATFWDAGEHAVAVEQACKSITSHTRQKTGCRLADDDLMSQLWSEKPPERGRPRLRLPGDRQTQTWDSRQRGARFLAMGCYAGLRNVVVHEHPDWSEQEALEALACLSVLARWIDEAEIEHVLPG